MHKISVSFIILSVSMCFAGDFVPNKSGAVLGTDLSEDLLEIDIKGQDALTTNQGKVCADFTSILKKLERKKEFRTGIKTLTKLVEHVVVSLFGRHGKKLLKPCCGCDESPGMVDKLNRFLEYFGGKSAQHVRSRLKRSIKKVIRCIKDKCGSGGGVLLQENSSWGGGARC